MSADSFAYDSAGHDERQEARAAEWDAYEPISDYDPQAEELAFHERWMRRDWATGGWGSE